MKINTIKNDIRFSLKNTQFGIKGQAIMPPDVKWLYYRHGPLQSTL